MPASIYHVYTNQVADGTATSVVRPSDWNSAHAITLAPSGAEIIGAFSNSPTVTFGTNASGYVTASAVGGGGGGVAISAGTNSTSTGTVAFANSNGLSFGMNTNGVVTGSYTVPNVPAQTEYVFSNSNGVTFGTNGSTVTASVVTDYIAGSNSSLFQQVSNTSAITSNAMNTSERGDYINTSQSSLFQQVSNTSAITANALNVSQSSLFQHTSATSAITSNAMNTSERGNYFYTSNNTFANSTHTHGNIAFSGTNVSATFTTASNGLSIQLSAPTVGGAQTGISGIIAGTNTITSGTVSFANANGVSFTGNGQNISASVRTDYAGTQFSGTNISGTINTNGISLSVNPGGAGGDGYNIIGVNGVTNTSLSATLVLSNANNVTFGLNASTITASASFAQTVQPVAYSAANGSANFSTLTFANSNGVSFSTGTQGLYATVKTDYLTTAAQSDHSHGNPTLALTNLTGTTASASNGLTLSLSAAAQTVQPVAYSAANGSANFSTLTFANSNGVSFSTGTQGLYATVKTDYLTSQSNQAASAANGSFTFQTLTFANSNGVSFSTGTQGLYASHNGITQQSTQPVAYSAANGSAAFSTLTFANSNGVSFSTGTQGLYATVATTYAASNHSHGNPTLALTNINGTTASASNGLTLSLSAVVPTQTVQPVAVSGSNGSFNFSTLSFGNLNGLSFYTSNGSIVGSYTDAGAGGGISAVVISAGTTNNSVSNFSFSNANNVSFGINGSTITASVNAGGGNAVTLSYFDDLEGVGAGATVGLSSRVSQASTIWLFPLNRDGFPGVMTVSTAMLNVFNSGNTNSISAALTYTWGLGIYQVTDVTRLTLINKASSVWTQSANANYSQSLVGQRWLTFHSTQFSNATGGAQPIELSDGGRYIAALSISSAGSAIQTHNFIGEYLYSTNARSGHMGVLSVTGTSKGFYPWLGQFSATSSAFPNSIGYNQINKQVASGNFRPQLILNNLGDLG